MLEVAIIITAAGLSTRFPPNKLLQDVSGKTCIEHTLDTFADFHLDTYVVLGHEGDLVQKKILEGNGRDVSFVYNSDYRSGLSSSVIAGIRQAGNAYDYWCFCPGDKPFIKTETVLKLLNRLEKKTPLILAPYYSKQIGHPIFFSRELGPSFLTINGDVGGRQLIENYQNRTMKLNVSDHGVVLDMDRYLDSEHV
ncbi:MAG: nucleotidyltransferase family protein [Candidatus Marinimicrobia bacterium]|nr:nucleotidyltransferase family protein [Candidatus Neomarinimicrobiota bacterium]